MQHFREGAVQIRESKDGNYVRYSYWRKVDSDLRSHLEKIAGHTLTEETLEDDECGLLYLYRFGAPLAKGGAV
jgi:hypothetical protein